MAWLVGGGVTSVATAATISDAVAAIGATTVPNVLVEGPTAGLSFIEKRIAGAEAYILRNGASEERVVDLVLPRARGRPERWDPWTGATAAFDAWTPTPAGPKARLHLDPYASIVLVFDPRRGGRRAAPGGSAVTLRSLTVGAGGEERWSFQATGRDRQGRDEVLTRSLDSLFDWSQDAELRHFSGRGHYAIEVDVDSIGATDRVVLDLGAVRDVAEIRVNGRPGPTLLLRPYRADVTELVHPGKNRLEVTVTNPLLNRLIGSGMTLGLVFGGAFGRAPDPLPAGLLGPVRLVVESTAPR
jgi:hypothetical protein